MGGVGSLKNELESCGHLAACGSLGELIEYDRGKNRLPRKIVRSCREKPSSMVASFVKRKKQSEGRGRVSD